MHSRRRFTARELDEQVRTIRILGVFALGIVLVGLAFWLAGIEVRDTTARPRPAPTRSVDPLQAELLRCNGLGQPALDDSTCRAAWAENRRRFFGGRERRQEPRP